jgi:hypothetical protein
MSEPIINAFLSLLALVFGSEPGTNEFYLFAGVTTFSFLVVARFVTVLFKGARGLMGTVVAMALPVLLGAVAYVMIEVYALPQIDVEPAPMYLPWVGFGILLLGTVLVISRRILSLNFGLCVIIFIFASAAAAGAFYGTQMLIDLMDQGGDRIEQRDERLKEEMEGISE